MCVINWVLVKSYADLLVPAIAAFIVGVMQVRIYVRQAKIAAHANDINLFKERLPIYRACIDILSEAIKNGGQVSNTVQVEYFNSVRIAPFVFSDTMVTKIESIYQHIVDNLQANNTFNQAKLLGRLTNDIVDRVHDTNLALQEDLKQLSSTFKLMRVTANPLGRGVV